MPKTLSSLRIWFGLCGAAFLMMGVIGPLSWPFSEHDEFTRLAWQIAIGSGVLGIGYLTMAFALPWLATHKAYLMLPTTWCLVLLAVAGCNVGGILIGLALALSISRRTPSLEP